ncbi:MAG: hypothetical protein M3R06_08435 [Chloroflexota bacterium]|nr:hypothetical protein [Chloroflexota bacterium]
MIWLTWRLQRMELVLLGSVLLFMGGLLALTRDDVIALNRIYTAETCPGSLFGTEGSCVVPVSRLYSFVSSFLPWFNLLPLLAAVLLILPVLLELEQGTHRLAWTQSVTRWHWARAKLTMLSLGGVAFAALFALLFHWWSAFQDERNGRLAQDYYDLRGTIPIGATLFAIGLMVAVGMALQRPIVATVVASGVYVAARVVMGLWIRPHLVGSETAPNGDPSRGENYWHLSMQWRNDAGEAVSERYVTDLCFSTIDVGRVAGGDCLAENGLVQFTNYHPESHYWPLQLMETGLFLVGGAALLGFAAWYVVRRVE